MNQTARVTHLLRRDPQRRDISRVNVAVDLRVVVKVSIVGGHNYCIRRACSALTVGSTRIESDDQQRMG